VFYGSGGLNPAQVLAGGQSFVRGKAKYVPLPHRAQYVMDMRKKKIIILGLCIGCVALAVYLGFLADREIPPFEISKVYSLPLSEDEKIDVRYVMAVDLTGNGWKEILMSYDAYSYEEQTIEGALTVVISYKEARMVVFSSNTTGDFQKLWEYNSGLTRQTAATGDFDGDGKLDVVVGGFELENADVFPPLGTSVVEVLLQEDGSFDKVFSSNIPEFVGPGSIVANDFDGDGGTDFVVGGLAVESDSPYHAYLFHNESGGNFTMSPIALREGIVVEDMWKADVNNDGSSDLIIHTLDFDDETYSIILLLNDGRGEFEVQELDVSVDSMIIEDFTEKRYPDIIYTKIDQSGDKVYFLKNDQGEFAEPKPIDIPSEGRIVGMISAGFNNDNTLDILLLERCVEFEEEKLERDIIGHLFLIEEGPQGELSFTRKWSHKFLDGEEISSKNAAVAADINNDGWIDLILVSEEGEVYLPLNKHT